MTTDTDPSRVAGWCCDWRPSSPRPALLPLAIGGAAAHGPDPMLSGGLFAQNQDLRFRWRAGSVPHRRHQDRDQGRRGPGQRDPRIQGGDVHLRRRRRQPDRLWTRRDLRRQRPGLLHPQRPDRLHDVAARTGPRLRLGHAQVVPGVHAAAPNGCYDAETIALDEFGHVEGLDHHGNYANDSDYLDAVVQTYSRTKPASGWNMHAFGRCDVASLQLQYDMQTWSAKYSTCLDLATDLAPERIVDARSPSAARRRSPRRSRSWTTTRTCGSAATRSRARTVTLQRRAAGTSTWASVGTMAVGAAGGTYVTTLSPRSDADYRAVFATPSNEGINGDTSPTVSVLVFSLCEAGIRLARPPTRRASDQEGRNPDAIWRPEDRCAGVAGHRRGRDDRRGLRQRRARRVGRRIHGRADAPRSDRRGRPGRRRPRPAPRPRPTRPRPTRRRPPAPASSTTAGAPPAATLAADGGDPAVGQLGSYTWLDGGSDSPWLPGTPLTVGAGEPLTVTIGRRRGRRRLVRPSRDGGDDRRQRGDRARRRPPARRWPLPRRQPARWSVQVTVRFAQRPRVGHLLLAAHGALNDGIGVAHFPRRCRPDRGHAARRPLRRRRVAVGLAVICAIVLAACSNQAPTPGAVPAGLLALAAGPGGTTLTGWDSTGADGTPIKLPQGETTWISAGRAAVLAATLASGKTSTSDPVHLGKPLAWRPVKAKVPTGETPAGPDYFATWDPEGGRFATLAGDLLSGDGIRARARRPLGPDRLRDPARSIRRGGAAGLDRRRSRRGRHR